MRMCVWEGGCVCTCVWVCVCVGGCMVGCECTCGCVQVYVWVVFVFPGIPPYYWFIILINRTTVEIESNNPTNSLYISITNSMN